MHYIDYHKEKRLLKPVRSNTNSKYIDYYDEQKALPVSGYQKPETEEEKVVFIDSNKIPVVVLVPTEQTLLTKTAERDKLNKQATSPTYSPAEQEEIKITETNSDLTV